MKGKIIQGYCNISKRIIGWHFNSFRLHINSLTWATLISGNKYSDQIPVMITSIND